MYGQKSIFYLICMALGLRVTLWYVTIYIFPADIGHLSLSLSPTLSLVDLKPLLSVATN